MFACGACKSVFSAISSQSQPPPSLALGSQGTKPQRPPFKFLKGTSHGERRPPKWSSSGAALPFIRILLKSKGGSSKLQFRPGRAAIGLGSGSDPGWIRNPFDHRFAAKHADPARIQVGSNRPRSTDRAKTPILYSKGKLSGSES